MTSPKWYDITLKAGDELENDYEQLLGYGMTYADKFGFQLEMGEQTGYLHWQCRYQLKVGRLESAVIKQWTSLFGAKRIHVAPTSTMGRNFDYVTKSKTSLGYRYCTELPQMDVFADQENGTLREWQKRAIKMLDEQSDREILCCCDTEGAIGKTWLTKWLVWNRNAQAVPKFDESQDMVAVAMANKQKRIFIFDLPRAEGKSTKAMWSAIEQVKNGHLYDKRNSWKECWIKPPKILVFTNAEPDMTDLSEDRWTIMRNFTDYAEN